MSTRAPWEQRISRLSSRRAGISWVGCDRESHLPHEPKIIKELLLPSVGPRIWRERNGREGGTLRLTPDITVKILSSLPPSQTFGRHPTLIPPHTSSVRGKDRHHGPSPRRKGSRKHLTDDTRPVDQRRITLPYYECPVTLCEWRETQTKG